MRISGWSSDVCSSDLENRQCTIERLHLPALGCCPACPDLASGALAPVPRLDGCLDHLHSPLTRPLCRASACLSNPWAGRGFPAPVPCVPAMVLVRAHHRPHHGSIVRYRSPALQTTSPAPLIRPVRRAPTSHGAGGNHIGKAS